MHYRMRTTRFRPQSPPSSSSTPPTLALPSPSTLSSSSLSSSGRPSRIFFNHKRGKTGPQCLTIAADMKAGGKATLAKKVVQT